MKQLTSLCMLSVHTCPVAALGGKKTGGMNVYIRDLARELGARGIRVDIFTRCEAQDTAEVKRLGPKVNVIHIPAGPEKSLDPINIYPHLDEFTINVLNYVNKAKRRPALQAKANPGQPDYQLIHSHYWLSGLVALKLREAWHTPILHTFHTLIKVKNLFLPTYQSKQSLTLLRPIQQQKLILKEAEIRIPAEGKLVNQVNHILAYTPDEKQHLIKLYSADPAKIFLIPPGVDTNRFKPIPKKEAKSHIGIRPNQKLLLFVGRLDPIKNLENLLQALALLEKHTDCHHVCLAVIGGDVVRQSNRLAKRLNKQSVRSSVAPAEKQDKYLNSIQTLAKNLGVSSITAFLGSQDQRILPYYYSAAEMTIIPSSHESFGLVALESMACATPVIASNVGGLKYLVKHKQTGFLVAPNNPKSLTHSINTLLKDKNLRQKMGTAAHTHAQTYSWKYITQKVLKIYKQLYARGIILKQTDKRVIPSEYKS